MENLSLFNCKQHTLNQNTSAKLSVSSWKNLSLHWPKPLLGWTSLVTTRQALCFGCHASGKPLSTSGKPIIIGKTYLCPATYSVIIAIIFGCLSLIQGCHCCYCPRRFLPPPHPKFGSPWSFFPPPPCPPPPATAPSPRLSLPHQMGVGV